MRKKVLGLMIAICIIATSLTLSVSADDVQSYEVWVRGVQVTSANAADVMGDGKVSYDADTNTLTLNGAQILPQTIKDSAICSTGDLNVVLAEDSRNYVAGRGYGIEVGGTLTIKGEGTLIAGGWLELDGLESDYTRCGINAKNVVILGGKINTVAYRNNDNDEEVYGIRATEKLYISNAEVTATAQEASGISGASCAIYGGSDVLINNSEVTAESGTAEGNRGNSCGIFAGKNLVITDSDVTAKSGNVGSESTDSTLTYGIYTADGNIVITNSTVVSEAGSATGKDSMSSGITAFGDIRILSGSVKAAGGESEDSFGMAAMGNTYLLGGVIEAFSHGENGRDIYATNDVVIGSAEVKAVRARIIARDGKVIQMENVRLPIFVSPKAKTDKTSDTVMLADVLPPKLTIQTIYNDPYLRALALAG